MAKKFIRKLQRSGTHSYILNIPKEVVGRFGWRERQKLVVEFGGRKHELKIRDWVNIKKPRTDKRLLGSKK